MDEMEIERRLTGVEERAKSNQHRLDKLEEIAAEIHSQNESIAELVVELKHTNASLRDHDDRLAVIESRAGGRMETIFKAVVTALCGGLVGAAVSALLAVVR